MQERRPLFQFLGTALRAIAAWLRRIPAFFRARAERSRNTCGRNAIHMLYPIGKGVGDCFIVTTQDGMVIVIDGGTSRQTAYFLEYLRRVTGSRKPHVDAWFLTHPHDDHCCVFLDVVERYASRVTFDAVFLHFAPRGLYRETDPGAERILQRYARLRPQFADKECVLRQGDVLHIGDAAVTVLFAFDPDDVFCRNVNESSLVFRMDLGGRSVLFTGDCGVRAGKKIVRDWKDSGLLSCDVCKMAHHGQNGCDRDFYAAVSPDVCLWPTPEWVWNNRTGDLQTPQVRAWMRQLGVRRHYVSKDGTKLLLLGGQEI